MEDVWLDKYPLHTEDDAADRRPAAMGRMEADEGRSRGTEAGGRVGRKPFRLRAGPLAETGGHSAIACFGQSGEHVDPRRIDDRGPWADDGGAVRSSSIPAAQPAGALRQGADADDQ